MIIRVVNYVIKRHKQKKLKEKYGGTDDPMEMLEGLLDYGLLTQKEFESKKALLEA